MTYRDWYGKDRVPAVLAMSLVGNTVYAGTEQAGIFRSDDDGESWILVNDRLTSRTLNEIPVVSSLMVIENIIIAGTMGGLCRSEDAGTTWKQVSEGWGLPRGPDEIELQKVHSLVNMGRALYAAVESNIFRSEDKGTSWHPTGFHSSTVLVAGTNGTLYTGTRSDGIIRSKDEGKSWEEVNTGLPKRDQFGGFPYIHSLAEVGKRLYAGTDKGVFRWEDNTNTWIQTGLANFYVYSCVATPDSLYVGTNGGGVFRLDVGNDNWVPANTGLIASSIQSLAPIDGSIYAGTYGGGVFRSEDRGDSWISSNLGLTDIFVLSLGVIGGFLHAGTQSGDVFRLDGNSWIRTNMSEEIFVKLFIEVGERLYAMGDNRSSVICSEDGGKTWVPVGDGLPQQEFEINSLESFGTDIYAISNKGVYLSNDGGDTWYGINTGLTNHYVESLAMAGDTLYAGTWGDGVFRSRDMGFSSLQPHGKLPITLGRIKSSVLLQNYPNPFNPETWIPFILYESVEVEIRIYDTAGNTIRTLGLGMRGPGIYLSKEQAACWDGRNETGEQVASGVHFYSMEAGDYSSTKKMTILR